VTELIEREVEEDTTSTFLSEFVLGIRHLCLGTGGERGLRSQPTWPSKACLHKRELQSLDPKLVLG
jgi:hypothetical protein